MKLTVLEAAIRVLKDAGEALHVDEITKLMLETGLWTSASQTPATSVGAQLSKEINKNGDKSVLVRVAPQTYGLLDFDVKAKNIAAMPKSAGKKAPAATIPVEKGPVPKPSVDEPPVGVPPIDVPPPEKTPIKEPPAEDLPLEAPPAEKAPIGEPPAEKAPIKEPLMKKVPMNVPIAEKPPTVELLPDVLKMSPIKEAFSFVACVQKALESSGDKTPMHYREILAMAHAKGWLMPEDETSEAKMRSEVLNENHQRQKQAKDPRFVQHGGGYLGLSEWEKDEEAANDDVPVSNGIKSDGSISNNGDESTLVRETSLNFEQQMPNGGAGKIEPMPKVHAEEAPAGMFPPEKNSPGKLYIEKLHDDRFPPEIARPSSPPVSYTLVGCAQKALDNFANKRPMHYRDIIGKSHEEGWLVDKGEASEASLSSEVLDENKERIARGERPRFVQHGGGYLGLAEWEENEAAHKADAPLQRDIVQNAEKSTLIQSASPKMVWRDIPIEPQENEVVGAAKAIVTASKNAMMDGQD